MIDLILYTLLVLGLIWVGWDERWRPFDYEHAVPIEQLKQFEQQDEEGTNGAHD